MVASSKIPKIRHEGGFLENGKYGKPGRLDQVGLHNTTLAENYEVALIESR